MLSSSVIFFKIASMCLLMFFGYLSRRMKLVPDSFLGALSSYLLSIASPCFIIYNIPRTITRESIVAYWYFPLLGAGLLAICDIFGWASARLLVIPNRRPTFRFLIAFPNWIFLAIAVIEPLFGDEGIRMVLLFNAGINAYLWSFGLSGFKPGTGWALMKNIFLNIQIIATVVGMGLAVGFPFVATIHDMTGAQLAELPVHLGLTAAAWEGITFIGITTLPLSIFQIGLRLAAAPDEKTAGKPAIRKDNRTLAVCSTLRLIVAPVIIILTLIALIRFGLPLTEAEFLISVLIFSMPTGVTAMMIADLYGGDTLLTARTILWTTLASLGTVPVIAWLAQLTAKMTFP